ncbi:MAG TPA: AMP-binding protein, partial [Acidimicrobiales bacterium]
MATDAGAIAAGRRMAHGEQLARIARKHPNRTAFVCGSRRATFADIDGRVTRLAHALAERGVVAGDRVALLMGNSIEMVEAMFSGWRLGAVVVPVNFRLVADEVEFILTDSGATALVVDAALTAVADAARSGLPGLRTVVVRGEAAPPAEGLEDLVAGGSAEPLSIDVADEDPALILYTSGTTGRPKGAVLTHLNLVMSTLNSMITQGISGFDDVWYGNLPLFHVGGLSGILPYIIGGGCSIILPSGGFDAARAVEDLARHGVTGCVFIGMQWDEICDEIAAQRPVLRLRRVAWGAANTPVRVLERMQAILPGIPVFSFFGQTEMSPVTCVLHAEDADRKRGSVGRPIVNVEARLVDDDMHDVAVGEVGEIVYRGPTVMQGYWNMPDANERAFAGGWFHSGDLCRMDDEGYLYVVDRKTDMIISGGE